MTNQQAFKLIGERAAELAQVPEVQKKMLETAAKEGKKAAEKLLYGLAIMTLLGPS